MLNIILLLLNAICLPVNAVSMVNSINGIEQASDAHAEAVNIALSSGAMVLNICVIVLLTILVAVRD